MAEMTIHFHVSEKDAPESTVHGWRDIIDAVDEVFQVIDASDEDMEIHTTQMGILSTALLLDCWHIVVHREDGSECEIALGDGNPSTKRDIQPKHDLYKLWRAGEFD